MTTKTLWATTWILALSCALSARLQAAGVFLEQSGLIVIEVEAEPPAGDWVAETTHGGFTGASYYRMNGNTVQGGTANGVLSYRIRITNPGTYRLRIHSNKEDVGDSTWANDCYTRMVGQADYLGSFTKTYQSGSALTWRWSTMHEPTSGQHVEPDYTLTAGEHELQIAGRSKDFIIDRLVLFDTATVAEAAATNLSNPQSPLASGPGTEPVLQGELKKWHKITLLFTGPSSSEGATPNPFMDYRLDVTFTNGTARYVVPGYYCADGNAAHSGATSGDTWCVHFAPDATGTWSWSASFRSGDKVAVSTSAGASAGYFDGASGSFVVAATDKTGRDLRGKGRLQYVGQHHLRFAETGEFFVKGGADAPENFLAYQDFDGDFKNDGHNDHLIKTWSPHAGDWRSGDPTWQDGKGKGIIGAVNYLASKGMNVFSFLTMNIGGDDQNVFPYTTYTERLRLDVSRLAQWEIVLEHATHQGMYLHFKTQETENDQLLDSGELGDQRTLYYRELIARFGHQLALNWNLGEENTNTEAQRIAFAQFFYDHDPYRHLVVLHTFPSQQESVYRPLLGSASRLTGVSIQINWNAVHTETLKWVTESASAGKKWVVANDEQGGANTGVVPDADDFWHDGIRKETLWGNLMAGGAGVEYYFGYSYDHSDLTCEDFRSRDHLWDLTRHALDFFNAHLPFEQMQSHDALTSSSSDFVLAIPGDTYAIYLKNGGTTELDLGTASDTFRVQWFNPRAGGALQDGSVHAISGPGQKAIGNPPSDPSADWVALVQVEGAVTRYTLTVYSGAGDGSYRAQAVVPIVADAPAQGTVFDRWTGDVATVANALAASTTLTMPAADVTVTATYVDGSPGQMVTGFTLINADSNADIVPLEDGATLNLATLPTRNLNVRANTSPAVVGSVRFAYDQNASYQTESAAPYALAGDNAGDYNAWTPTVGGHTLTATPFTEASAQGAAGTARTVVFSVVDTTGPIRYLLTVNAGSGSGEYEADTVVAIAADAPAATLVFDRWVGDVASVADITASSTTITMPAAAATVTATYRASSGRSPYGGAPHPIPGRVEAEDYDEGGAQVAYHDTSAGNQGGAYRTDDVDIFEVADSASGHGVGWIEAGEWLSFTVQVTASGRYRLSARVAADAATGVMRVEFDGSEATGPLAIPATGAQTTFEIIALGEVELTGGVQELRLRFEQGGFDLDFIEARALAEADAGAGDSGAEDRGVVVLVDGGVGDGARLGTDASKVGVGGDGCACRARSHPSAGSWFPALALISAARWRRRRGRAPVRDDRV